jgi:thymidylate synthase (FAD)
MDTWRQWIRHRTANVNEYSTRYSLAIDSSQKTAPKEWRYQANDNKQGSEGYFEESLGSKLTERETEFQQFAREIYQERLQLGVAREQARKDLPLSTYTEAYWKVDLQNLLNFLALRMDTHAQLEIRNYASVIGNEIVSKWCPITWEAFKDYRTNNLELSGLEVKLIKEIITGNKEEANKLAEDFGWLNRIEGKLSRNRERTEMEEKLAFLGLSKPWM